NRYPNQSILSSPAYEDRLDPDLEWIYLNPAFEDPEPETCHGREQLRWALERQAERGLASQVEEVVAPRPGPGRATAAPARWHHRPGSFPGPAARPRGWRHPRISPGGIGFRHLQVGLVDGA